MPVFEWYIDGHEKLPFPTPFDFASELREHLSARKRGEFGVELRSRRNLRIQSIVAEANATITPVHTGVIKIRPGTIITDRGLIIPLELTAISLTRGDFYGDW